MRRRSILLAAFVALVAAGCGGNGTAADIEATRWFLKVYPAADGTTALAVLAPRTTATFERGTLSGTGGCNDYSAPYQLAPDTLTIGPVAATMTTCGDAIDAQEQAYFAALGRVASYRLEEGTLVLRDAGGDELLVLAAAQPLPLVGTPWEATSVSDGLDGILTIPPQAQVGLRLADDGRAEGFAGCNRFAGPYRELAGSAIRIGPLVTTRRACADPAAGDLETAFLAALDRTASYVISGTVLDLRDRDGLLQASLRLALPDLLPEPTASPAPTPAPTTSPPATPRPTSTPKPTAAPTATPKPTAAPTKTPKPTAAPTSTAKPTAAPTPTPVPLATCPLPAAGVVVSYPAAWFTVEDVPELACVLYGPEPVTVDPVTRQTNAKVTVLASSTVLYADVVAALTNRSTWTDVTTTQLTVSTLPATAILGTSTGTGSVPAGVTQYSYVVDRGGPNGIVMILTASREGDADAQANRDVVDLMAATIEIDARPK